MNRYLRDALLYKVGAGTMEIRRMLIGREFSESLSYNPVLAGRPRAPLIESDSADNDYAHM